MADNLQELADKVARLRDDQSRIEIALRAARKELDDATAKSSGLLHHIVEARVPYGYNGKKRTVTFIVERVAPRYGKTLYCFGAIIKQDGTVGSRRADYELETVKDLGLYSEAGILKPTEVARIAALIGEE